MPLGGRDNTDKEHTIIRMVNGVRGHIRLNVECDPAFNYARDPHTVSISGEWAHFRTSSTGMDLWSTESLTERNGSAVADLDVNEGSRSLFVLSHFEPDSAAPKNRGQRVGRREIHRNNRLLEGMDRQVLLLRALAGNGPPVSFGTEDAHIRADRSDHRGANYQPSRGDGRRA